VRRQAACAALLGAGIHPAAPVKRRGNRRYYQHHEVLLVRRIRELLYQEGFTISGARNRLEDRDPEQAMPSTAVADVDANGLAVSLRAELAAIIELLRCLTPRAWRISGLANDGGRFLCYNSPSRGVAQPGSALAWGARGREFESRRPDHASRR
jgi:DNA-binding transcriptional MerR regulator